MYLGKKTRFIKSLLNDSYNNFIRHKIVFVRAFFLFM